MKRTPIIIAVVVLLAVAAVAGFVSHHHGNGGSTKMSMTTDAVATNKVTIADYMFSPMAVRVKVGATVTWTNTDSVNHTVTADTPSVSAPSSMDIAPGTSFTYTFRRPGTYTYHCFPHPYMHGTILVTK